MNSTFKVVFNKARGALMVVNEVTSSVQAKGTKTVVATAVAAMIASVAGTAGATEVDSVKITGADSALTVTGATAEKQTKTNTVKVKVGAAAETDWLDQVGNPSTDHVLKATTTVALVDGGSFVVKGADQTIGGVTVTDGGKIVVEATPKGSVRIFVSRRWTIGGAVTPPLHCI